MTKVYFLLALALLLSAVSGVPSSPSDGQLAKLTTPTDDPVAQLQQDGKRRLRATGNPFAKAGTKVADAAAAVSKKVEAGAKSVADETKKLGRRARRSDFGKAMVGKQPFHKMIKRRFKDMGLAIKKWLRYLYKKLTFQKTR
ncbi:unnamed protein product [Hyaloperonospora brassicae]|uniref:RxLR effector protein n=1 Tax=Hyaloperonospora brassicae TaxID=162125 RepID=A0AAV0TL69_HYABA|nr:unnamed protein product [Hyaloperonospora brassicae]